VLYLCYPYSSAPHRYDSFRRYGWQSKARVILADAAWVAEEAQTFFQLPVSVVPVGTDPVRFSPNAELRAEMRRKLDFTEKDLVLLNVSSLEHRKGVWRVIEAMGRLVHQFPDLKYFILGQGASEQELRKLVADLGLDGRVIFGGTTPHLESYYNMADIFVMLPDAEANSVACHEAMSCALPVVVSNSGGFAESVPPDAGFLVDQDDPAQIDSKLIELISDSQLRLQMGQAGRANVVSHLSWDQIAERFLKVVA
jgi:glycosyltransferase involved in cell wall biosynthesis